MLCILHLCPLKQNVGAALIPIFQYEAVSLAAIAMYCTVAWPNLLTRVLATGCQNVSLFRGGHSNCQSCDAALYAIIYMCDLCCWWDSSGWAGSKIEVYTDWCATGLQSSDLCRTVCKFSTDNAGSQDSATLGHQHFHKLDWVSSTK